MLCIGYFWLVSMSRFRHDCSASLASSVEQGPTPHESAQQRRDCSSVLFLEFELKIGIWSSQNLDLFSYLALE